MKTYIITAHIPSVGSGETASVVAVGPSGAVYPRENIRPHAVPDLLEDGYAVDLMRRMFPASGPILGDRLVLDTSHHGLALSKGRVRVWVVDVEGDLPES